jgi:hypothetical protein
MNEEAYTDTRGVTPKPLSTKQTILMTLEILAGFAVLSFVAGAVLN